MRIRSIKPEFWRSHTIASVSWDARLVLKGLESYVDDNGVGKDDIELIITEVFPRDYFRNPRDTLARVSEAVSELHQAGLIARYEFDGEKLLYIDKWKDIQRIDRPGKGRYRRPDGTLDYSEPVDRDSYRSPRDTLASPRDTLAPVTGEQGNRGTGAKSACVGTSSTDRARETSEQQPTGRPVPSDGWKLIRDEIETTLPQAVKTSLAIEAATLLHAGTPEALVREALRLWNNKPGLGPKILPHLVSDIQRGHGQARAAPNGVADALALAAKYEEHTTNSPHLEIQP